MSRFFKNTKGSPLVEYSVLGGLISVLALVAVFDLGGEVGEAYSATNSTLSANIWASMTSSDRGAAGATSSDRGQAGNTSSDGGATGNTSSDSEQASGYSWFVQGIWVPMTSPAYDPMAPDNFTAYVPKTLEIRTYETPLDSTASRRISPGDTLDGVPLTGAQAQFYDFEGQELANYASQVSGYALAVESRPGEVFIVPLPETNPELEDFVTGLIWQSMNANIFYSVEGQEQPIGRVFRDTYPPSDF